MAVPTASPPGPDLRAIMQDAVEAPVFTALFPRVDIGRRVRPRGYDAYYGLRGTDFRAGLDPEYLEHWHLEGPRERPAMRTYGQFVADVLNADWDPY